MQQDKIQYVTPISNSTIEHQKILSVTLAKKLIKIWAKALEIAKDEKMSYWQIKSALEKMNCNLGICCLARYLAPTKNLSRDYYIMKACENSGGFIYIEPMVYPMLLKGQTENCDKQRVISAIEIRISILESFVIAGGYKNF